MAWMAGRHGWQAMCARSRSRAAWIDIQGTVLMADLEQLTDRQREVYKFIREKIHSRGYGPTVREIGAQFGIASPNGVMCHLRALERKGLVDREPNLSRAITLATEPPFQRGL